MDEKSRSIVLNGITNAVRCSGFCVDTFGNIIITDTANSQIKFFTKEGNLFETMDKFSNETGCLDEIIGVAWMTNQKLVVLRKESTFTILEMYSWF